METVSATQIHGTQVLGRLHMTTEAICPHCASKAAYVHLESHASLGQWYACEHIRGANYEDSGFIESVEFSNS